MAEIPDDGNDFDMGLPVMPAIAYPMHILWVPAKAFLVNVSTWALVMVVTYQPLLFLIGWVPTQLILMWWYFKDPYFVEVISAWWSAGLWPRFRRTKNVYPARGNKYLA